MQPHTVICFALKEEAAPFRQRIAGKSGIALLLLGIGRKNAEKSLREFLSSGEAGWRPALVLTCGFAGGLKADLKADEVFFETGDENLQARLRQAGARPAGFFCADRIATTAAEKRALREQTKADVVEMESGAVQMVCQELGIPCATVRVISDTADEDLPLDFNALSKPDKNLDWGKLLLAIARSPGKIGALMQLQKKTRRAADRLAEVLDRVISP